MTENNIKNLIRLYGFADKIVLTTEEVYYMGEEDYQFIWKGHVISCSFCFRNGSCSRYKYEDKIRCTLNDIWMALK